MTVSTTIICSTCGHKIRLRFQVGFIDTVTIKVACNKCGKLIKGGFTTVNDEGFLFDNMTDEFDNVDQVVSISTEFPIDTKEANKNDFPTLSPFIAITKILTNENILLLGNKIGKFVERYNDKFDNLVSCCDIFENKQWEYFLIESKLHFRPSLSLKIKTFEECAIVINEIFKDFYCFIATEYYDTNFWEKLETESIESVKSKTADLKSIKLDLEKDINLEEEYIKGIKLMIKFLVNIKSFIPVISLSYTNNFNYKYLDTYALTTFEFLDLKELYIEQFEYLSRISSLYFGLINLKERNNFNDFGIIHECSDLLDYCAKDNGIKKDIIKKLPTLNDYFLDNLNSQIRNGIGHLKTKYEPKTQLIKYYPFKDKAKVNTYKEIYLIDFAYSVLQQALKVRDSIQILTKFLNLSK